MSNDNSEPKKQADKAVQSSVKANAKKQGAKAPVHAEAKSEKENNNNKEDKTPTKPKGPCETYARGQCKWGKECRFVHDPKVFTSMTQAQGFVINVCILDVTVDANWLISLQHHFKFLIVNGDNIHEHAMMRAERTAMWFWICKRASGNTLNMQHTYRGWLPPGDCCCVPWWPDDKKRLCDIVARADGLCEHSSRSYENAVLLDSPTSEEDARQLFARMRGLKCIYWVGHLYREFTEIMWEQTATWVQAHTTTGSLGKRLVGNEGTETMYEPDLFWLIHGNVDGLKVNRIHHTSAYDVIEITPRMQSAREPVIAPIASVLNSNTPAGTYKVRDGVVNKFGPKFAVLRQGLYDWPFNTDEVRSVLNKCEGRDTTDTLRARAAVAASQIPMRQTDTDVLIHVVLSLKSAAEIAPVLAGFAPESEAGVCGTTWFPWLTPARRTVYEAINAARSGEVPHSTGVVSIVAAVLTFMAAMMRWPISEVMLRAEELVIVSTDCVRPKPVEDGVCVPLWMYMGLPHNTSAPTFVLEVAREVPTGNGYSWGSMPVRMVLLMVVVFFGFLTGKARAEVFGPEQVYNAYMVDHHMPIVYSGPLAPNGVEFALPGIISNSPLKQTQLGCKITPSTALDDGSHERPALFAIGLAFGEYIPNVYRSCAQNELIAASNRQAMQLAPHDACAFDAVTMRYRISHAITASSLPSYSSLFELWNARFPAAKQKRHLEAYDNWFGSVLPNMSDVWRASGMIKVEKRIQNLLERKDGDPRFVTILSDLYNVVAGPFMYGLTKIMKENMTQGNDVLLNSNSTNDEKQPDLFADAINAVELGRWFDSVYDTQSACAVCGDDQVIGVRLQKADGVWTVMWIVIDGVRHDAHMHDQFDEFWWERVKAYIGQIPEQVERIVKQGAKHTIGRTLHGVKFEIVSRTRSGDASTKIKNSICTHLVAREVIEFTKEHASYAGGAELVETSAYHAKLTAHLKESMGYDVEMLVTEDVSKVDFLSGLFYPIEGRTIWGPKAGKLIPRLGWTCIRVFGHRMWRQLAGTINSFQAYRFIPFVRVYIEHVMTLIPHEFRLTPPTEMRQINTTGIIYTQPTADTWAFFQARYGLSQREEDQFRVELRVATSLPFMLNSAILSILAEVDL